MKNLSYEQMMELMLIYKIVLIDVQTEQDYKLSHIPGSINIPLEKISAIIEDVVQDKNSPIILCCQKGIRSVAAVDILMKKGYRNLYNLKGGF